VQFRRLDRFSRKPKSVEHRPTTSSVYFCMNSITGFEVDIFPDKKNSCKTMQNFMSVDVPSTLESSKTYQPAPASVSFPAMSRDNWLELYHYFSNIRYRTGLSRNWSWRIFTFLRFSTSSEIFKKRRGKCKFAPPCIPRRSRVNLGRRTLVIFFTPDAAFCAVRRRRIR